MAIDNNLRLASPGELLEEYQTGMPSYDDDFDVKPTVQKEKRSSVSFRDALGTTPVSNTAARTYVEARDAGFGRSKYDVDYRPGEDIENERALAQSGWSKIGTGLTKMGTTALSTFVNTTAGTVWGAVSAGAELYNQLTDDEPGVSARKIVGAGVNNPVSEWLTDFQRKSEEWFPNYRTTRERSEQYQKEWWKHIATANFIGDSLIKNLGFTIGAMAGGAAWSRLALQPLLRARAINNIMKGAVAATGGNAAADAAIVEAANAINSQGLSVVQAEKLLRNIEKSARTLNKMDARLQLFGAGISALGEGSVEGLMAKSEFLEDFNTKINQAQQAELESVASKILEENDSRNIILDSYEMPDGTIQMRKRLSPRGIAEMQYREKQIAEKYDAMRQYAEERGEELASTVFGLNMFILPASNFVQFGKLFAGGWKTARKTLPVKGELSLAAREISGDIAKNSVPAIKGEFKATGNKFLRGLGKSAKVAGTEATEEMLQGVASSGAKKVADGSMTAYNDGGYDEDSVSLFSDEWLKLMRIGGEEYLSDSKNWQEGFLGAVTGLLGLPSFSRGQGWSGGVIGAAQEAGQEIDATKDAVAKLNSLIKSDEFQERWHSYIRGMKYSNEMDAAAAADDEYAWHTAYDNKLINDIMAFDKAGKLNELSDLADDYANLDGIDLDSIRELIKKDDTNPYKDEVSKMSDADLRNRIAERANILKDSIKQYKDIYDDLSARSRVDTSPELLSELLFTANQIKFFEKRFVDVLGKTMGPLRDIIGLDEEYNKQEGKDHGKIQRLERMLNSLTNFYTKNTLPYQMPKFLDTQTSADLRLLGQMVEEFGNDEQKKQVEDLVKLAKARSDFYKKLATLQTEAGQRKFEETRMTPEKVEQQSQKKAAEAEVESFNSLQAVRDKYNAENKRSLGSPEEFVARIRKAKDTNPHVATFVDMYDDFTEVRSLYIRQNGTPSGLANQILGHLFNTANRREDITDTSKLQSHEQFLGEMRVRVSAISNMDEMLKYADLIDVSADVYNNEIGKIAGAMNQLASLRAAKPAPAPVTPAPAPVAPTSPTQPTVPVSPAPAPVTGIGTDPSAPSTTAAPAQQKPKASIAADSQSATDSVGRTWNVGETVYFYDSTKKNPVDYETYTVKEFKQEKNDVKAVLVDGNGKERTVGLTHQTPSINKQPPAQPASTTQNTAVVTVPVKNPTQVELIDEAVKFSDTGDTEVGETQSGKKLYYNTAMPEFTIDSLRKYRQVFKDTRPGSPERVAALKQAMQGLEANTEKYKDSSFMRKLINENAYINAVTNIEVGDKVKFIAFADVEKYEGKPVIYMAVEKNGQRYVFNMVRRKGLQDYDGLQSFIDAFDAEYNSFISQNPNQDFVFSKESTVWGKRAGILHYDYSPAFSGERAVKTIEGYDPKAPIVWINKEGQYEVLRGQEIASSELAKLLSFDDGQMQTNRGSIYYLANSGDGGYIPIRLGIEHFTPDTKGKYQGNPTFDSIRKSIEDITNIANGAFERIMQVQDRAGRQAIVQEENVNLHNAVSELRKYLNLTTSFFTLQLNKDGFPILIYDRNAAVKGTKRSDNQKFDGFYLGANNIASLADKLAEEKLSLDFYPYGSGTDTGHKTLSAMIENGFITSNATRMLPKNVDVYMTRWENGDFVPTLKQKDIISGPAVADPEAAYVQEGNEPIPASGAPDISALFTPVAAESEEFGPTEVAPPVLAFDSLTDEQREAIAEEPYSIKSKEDFEMKKNPNNPAELIPRTEKEKEHILECAGVL